VIVTHQPAIRLAGQFSRRRHGDEPINPIFSRNPAPLEPKIDANKNFDKQLQNGL
jgi:hypothetical protein